MKEKITLTFHVIFVVGCKEFVDLKITVKCFLISSISYLVISSFLVYYYKK